MQQGQIHTEADGSIVRCVAEVHGHLVCRRFGPGGGAPISRPFIVSASEWEKCVADGVPIAAPVEAPKEIDVDIDESNIVAYICGLDNKPDKYETILGRIVADNPKAFERALSKINPKALEALQKHRPQPVDGSAAGSATSSATLTPSQKRAATIAKKKADAEAAEKQQSGQ